jgi:hypothetical protein
MEEAANGSTLPIEYTPVGHKHTCDKCGEVMHSVQCNVGNVLQVTACHAAGCLGLMRAARDTSSLWQKAITHEWYAPNVEQWNRMCKSFPKSAAYVAEGGLLLRQRRSGVPVLCVGGRYVRNPWESDHIPDLEMEKALVEYKKLESACYLWKANRKKKEECKKCSSDRFSSSRKAKQR